jgi:hypothetical protein
MSETTEELQPKSAPAKAKAKKAAKKKNKKKASKAAVAKSKADGARARLVRSFPAATFEESIVLADAFQKYAAGQEKVRRLTLFDKLGKSADSGTSRQLVTNSSKYGLTKGSYAAEFLELTIDGALATGEDVALPLKLDARFRLAIKQIEPFNFLYERCKGNKMPGKEFLLDALRETAIDEDALSECVDTFTLNAKYLGLLRTLSGTERLITFEHALDELGPGGAVLPPTSTVANVIGAKSHKAPSGQETTVGFDDVCFYISPIGADDSQQRKHADFFMEFVVEPALKEFNLKLVRADQIG